MRLRAFFGSAYRRKNVESVEGGSGLGGSSVATLFGALPLWTKCVPPVGLVGAGFAPIAVSSAFTAGRCPSNRVVSQGRFFSNGPAHFFAAPAASSRGPATSRN